MNCGHGIQEMPPLAEERNKYTREDLRSIPDQEFEP